MGVLFFKTMSSDRLTNGASLTQGNSLQSTNQAYFITMQGDGNLVLYVSTDHRPHNAVWSSKSNGKGTAPYKLIMQDDGNLVVYDTYSTAIWASNTNKKGTKPHRCIIQNDRNFVIYDGNNTATWASNT